MRGPAREAGREKDLLAQLGRSPDHGDAFVQSFAF